MCGAGAVIAGVATAASIGGQIASHEAKEDQAEARRAAARRAFGQEVEDIGRAQAQIEERRASNIFQAERRAERAIALERVSQGEAGVAGISAEAVRRDLERDAAEFRTAVDRRTEQQIRELEERKAAAAIRRENRIAGAPGPTTGELALGVLGAGLQGASSIIAAERLRTAGPDPDAGSGE